MDTVGTGPAKVLGRLIRERPRATGLTQRGLAEAAGVSLGGLRDLEQGLTSRPRRAAAERVAALALPGPPGPAAMPGPAC